MYELGNGLGFSLNPILEGKGFHKTSYVELKFLTKGIGSISAVSSDYAAGWTRKVDLSSVQTVSLSASEAARSRQALARGVAAQTWWPWQTRSRWRGRG